MSVWLAFYRGKGRFSDRLIRWAGQSEFSHVELTFDAPPVPDQPAHMTSLSASGRDGGVRRKLIAFDPERWVFVPVPWACTGRALSFVNARMGQPYDWAGLLFAQVFHLRRAARDRWFCSELVAAALGLPQPQTLSPGDLYLWVRAMNNLHARSTGAQQEDQDNA